MDGTRLQPEYFRFFFRKCKVLAGENCTLFAYILHLRSFPEYQSFPVLVKAVFMMIRRPHKPQREILENQKNMTAGRLRQKVFKQNRAGCVIR